ncbi:hypothetical protein MTP09_09420 [Chryseobacterium suipulveris]|uniref:Addiction module toxin RelE n=1 Tax=Chryseobacterium suipulveris TaxID=2929800 RepID=A0ABY4BMY8_9FLAO|nr:hypothetical protein [Chryseobacterium suipulveris]UOE40139.1 hypothetical protein MTP09_09420 [Chryseobacterium suipulveris]
MKYKKIKPQNFSEEELREIWKTEYCQKKIMTFDGILVQFFDQMFDHCFFESDNRRKKDKSILSLNRLEKIFWIKDTLQDPDAILKEGWNSKTGSYESSRRVALVKNNYIVVIIIFNPLKARFVTAYEVNNDENLEKILASPDYRK